LLNDLVERVGHLQQAVVLSADGLLIATSAGLAKDDADHFAAVASGLQSLARGAGRRFGTGSVRQTIVEMDAGFMLVTAAGHGACLAILAGSDADIGLITYEMAMLVARVGQYLATTTRTPADSAGAP
jgi:predicted regulator of Ras-like GTPase activity (Roadblock/LC7/MglB family)